MTTIYLCRHGDTEYSPTRRLAGRTDLELTAAGETTARKLGERLRRTTFDRAWCSPLRRARRTAELAGFGDRITIDARLREMDFGDYEGRQVADIRETVPRWTYLDDGCPGGETAADVAARCDAFLRDLGHAEETVVLFAHSAVLRVLTARYLGLPPSDGAKLMMAPGAIGILTYDEFGLAPAIEAWNDRGHLT